MTKLSDYVLNKIQDTGIGHVFYLPGGGCMHLVDSLGQTAGLEPVCCLHEQAATIAAEAYSQFNNELGVALVTTGPGATNAITGVAGAWIDSTPLLVVSGQAKRADLMGDKGIRQMGIQEVDIVPIVQSITKYAVTVRYPEDIRYHLEKALYLATHGRRGPVWLDIPLDVQGCQINPETLRGFQPDELTVDTLSDSELDRRVVKMLSLLSQSKRPVILAGNGIRAADAQASFEALVRKLGIPVLLSWKATDFYDESDALCVGRPGILGQRGANFCQQNADFILCLGARLDLPQIGFNHEHFAREAVKVVVDIDAKEIDKINTLVDVPIPVDVRRFMDTLSNTLLNTPGTGCYTDWLRQCKQWQATYPTVLDSYRTPQGPVNLYHLIDVLSELLQDDDVIVPGSSGACAEVTLQAFRVKRGQRLLNTPGLGSMGFGLPASFGACLASGGRRTIGVVGDGGIQHNIQELATLARLNLPIKLFVLNNNGYGSIRNMQKAHFDSRFVGCHPESGLTIADNMKVAQAYGLQAVQITDQTNLSQSVSEVLASEGTVICDVILDPDVPTAPRMSSKALPDGRMVSLPMEDLWPFLDREEFKRNMLVPIIEEKP